MDLTYFRTPCLLVRGRSEREMATKRPSTGLALESIARGALGRVSTAPLGGFLCILRGTASGLPQRGGGRFPSGLGERCSFSGNRETVVVRKALMRRPSGVGTLAFMNHQ